MKKAKKSSAKRDRLPDRSSELLVNQRMLYAVRDELKADIRSHDQRFDAIDTSLREMRAFLESSLHRMTGLMEEQNNRNIAVLDGYQSLYDRQDRLELRQDEVERTVSDFKKALK